MSLSYCSENIREKENFLLHPLLCKTHQIAPHDPAGVAVALRGAALRGDVYVLPCLDSWGTSRSLAGWTRTLKGLKAILLWGRLVGSPGRSS